MLVQTCPHLQTSSSRATEFERQILNWRIRRLVNSGLLRKQVISYLAAEALYSITRGGIQALEELGVTHLGGYVEREKDPHAAQISRVLELNRIRLALERSGTLALWVPETFIRVVNLSPTFCYAKVYDAVATVDLGNKVWAEFAIEDERTLKTEQKYAKILEGFATERRVQTILYLTQSYEIVATLRWYFRHARLEILLGLVNEFKEDVLDCQVDRAVDYSRMTLREALSRAASISMRRKRRSKTTPRFIFSVTGSFSISTDCGN
jgi:hypothetical protein